MASFRELTLERGDGTVLVDRCVLADKMYSRLVGLVGRSRLDAGEGLLMRPAFSVHTSFLRFPIDVVFLDKSLSVIGLAPELKPWRAAVKRGAHAVLELPSGDSTLKGLQVGEELRLVDGPRVHRNGGGLDAEEDVERIRIAVVSRDRRFSRLAGFLLARHGHVVETLRTAGEARQRAETEGLDVVVLDASSSVGAAARSVRALHGASPGLGVVVVADHPSDELPRSLRVLEKWGSFDDIAAEIRQAYSGNGGY